MPKFARDILGAVLEGWRECGDVVRFRGLRTMTLVARPDDVKHVLDDRQENYPRSKVVRDYLRPIMGNGIFVSDGELWRRQRRLLEPLFDARRMAEYGPVITQQTEKMLDRWEPYAGGNATLDVQEQMRDLTLDIVEHVLFGHDGTGDSAFKENAVTAIEYAIPRVMAPVNPPAFLPAGRRCRRALRALDSVVARQIAERRAGARSGDLLSAMLAARDAETGEGMTDAQARDEVMTTVFGAYKGLPQGLAWTWYALAEHSGPRERLRAELEAVLAGRTPTVDDLPRLPYPKMVIEEVLRLYPPLWIWSRPPVEEDEIGGYRIPAGMFVLNIPYVTHRHEEFWESPEEFDPERFAPERRDGRHPGAYFPFATGPRKCIAESFALMTMQLVVGTVAQRYRLELVPGYEIKRDLEFLLRPANGMPMTVSAT